MWAKLLRGVILVTDRKFNCCECARGGVGVWGAVEVRVHMLALNDRKFDFCEGARHGVGAGGGETPASSPPGALPPLP